MTQDASKKQRSKVAKKQRSKEARRKMYSSKGGGAKKKQDACNEEARRKGSKPKDANVTSGEGGGSEGGGGEGGGSEAARVRRGWLGHGGVLAPQRIETARAAAELMDPAGDARRVPRRGRWV